MGGPIDFRFSGGILGSTGFLARRLLEKCMIPFKCCVSLALPTDIQRAFMHGFHVVAGREHHLNTCTGPWVCPGFMLGHRIRNEVKTDPLALRLGVRWKVVTTIFCSEI